MTTFMDKDFLLNTETARKLYHDYAASCPIIDYHCHISPKEIWEDQRFENITKVWLGGDHYKWRLMRCQRAWMEYYITGGASDSREVLQVGGGCRSRQLATPSVPLERIWNCSASSAIDGTLSAKTADEVWNLANETLAEARLHHARPDCHAVQRPKPSAPPTTRRIRWSITRRLLAGRQSFKTYTCCPHGALTRLSTSREPGFAWRTSRSSEKAAGDGDPATFADLKAALEKRYGVLPREQAAVLSDHGTRIMWCMCRRIDAAIEAIFAKKAAGETLTDDRGRAVQDRDAARSVAASIRTPGLGDAAALRLHAATTTA